MGGGEGTWQKSQEDWDWHSGGTKESRFNGETKQNFERVIIVQGIFLPFLMEVSLHSLDTGHSCSCSEWLTQQPGVFKPHTF